MNFRPFFADFDPQGAMGALMKIFLRMKTYNSSSWTFFVTKILF